MTIEVIELQDDDGKLDERGSNHSGRRVFMVTGTFVHNEAWVAARAEADDTITIDDETLYLGSFKCESEQADIWKCTADYISEEEKEAKEEKQQKQDQEFFVPKWDADTSGATHHITSSYRTRQWGEFGTANGEVTKRYSNAINVRKTKTGFDVKGVDVIVPNLELSATVRFPPNFITVDLIKQLARATGKTNNATWYDFEAGELLFKGVRLKGATFQATEAIFMFSASENIHIADNFKIGDIGPIEKNGHEYLWVEYENREGTDENGNPLIFPAARYAFVEQIYREFNFNGLGIGG